MDIDALKKVWAEHNDKLDRVWAINVELRRDQKQQSVNADLRRQVRINVAGMLAAIVMVVWMGLHAATHSSPLTAVIPAAIVGVLSQLAIFGSAAQLSLLRRVDPGQPIVHNQRAVLQLRQLKTRINRVILYVSFFFIWSLVFVLLELDPIAVFAHVWAAAPIVLIVHSGVGVLWIPFCWWLLRRYDRGENGGFIARLRDESALTVGSVSPTLNRVLAQLEELSEFEQPEDGAALG